MLWAFSQNSMILTCLLWFYLVRMIWLTNVWFVLLCTPRCPTRFFTDMVPHCIYDWVLVYMLHNTYVLIHIDWLSDIVFWSLSTWMMWKWMSRIVWRCNVMWQVVEWRELCLSKLYFVYMICISTCCLASLYS